MITEDIQVLIRKDHWRGSVGIQFRSRRDGKTFIAKPVQLVFEERTDRCQPSEPTLEIDDELAPSFFQALAEALDERGVKTENDHVVAGKLEAMKAHLEDVRDHYEDMRSIACRVLPKDPTIQEIKS